MRLQTKFVVLVIGLGVMLCGASFAVLFALHAESVALRAEATSQAQAERAYRLLEQRLDELTRLVQARIDAATANTGEAPPRESLTKALQHVLSNDAAAAYDFGLVRVHCGEDPQAILHAVGADEQVRAASWDINRDADTQSNAGLRHEGDALFETVVVPVRGSSDAAVTAYVVVGRNVGNSTRHEPLGEVVLGETQRGAIEVLTLAEAYERGFTGEPGEEWVAGNLFGTLPGEHGGGEEMAAVLVRQLGSDEPLLLAVHPERSTRPLVTEVLMMTAALVFGGLLLMAATIIGLHIMVVRRLQRLARYAERVRSPGDLGRRPIEDAGNDEIGELYRSMEMMLDRIEDQANALRLTNEELMAALHAKDEFFHATSHELRTPLATISGFLDRLEQQLAARAGQDNGSSSSHETTGEATRSVGEIKQAALHLLHLIDEMLELSRARAGKLPFEMGPVDVFEVLEDVRRLTSPQAQGKALELEFVQHAEEVAAVRADHRRLVQTLLNLVSNAIKYTGGANGRVEVQLEEVGSAHLVRIHVRDNGPGIPPEQQARLFEPFFRGSTSGNEPGVGLGLAIVKDFVERMNGKIDLTSQPGQGSRFTVSLPLFAAWEEGHRPTY